MNKAVLATTLICSSFLCSASEGEGKYRQGDCIMGNDAQYSWNGQIAAVEAYSEISGFLGPKYILNFPRYKSSAVVFDKNIEEHTIKVGEDFCREL
ncbi:hypothetical protein [Enterobacter ludwigii]|uniref:hypothetical protein n=1 Tax=Enterobacter ludwigii TaxID=299767 RepID=UPI002FCF02EB